MSGVLPPITNMAKSGSTLKDRKIAERAHVLGMGLVLKRVTFGGYTEVSTGFLLKGLLKYKECNKKVFFITSDIIVSKEDACEIQSGRKALNTEDYKLCFKKWDSSVKLRRYRLDKVTSSKEKVAFICGLAIIPISAKKLSSRSGIITYRPFTAIEEKSESLGDSFCHVVDGSMDGFSVKSFHLVQRNKEYVLELPERGVSFKTLSELTRGGVSSPYLCLGAILKSGEAAGFLTFVDGKVMPISLFELSLHLEALGMCIMLH